MGRAKGSREDLGDRGCWGLGFKWLWWAPFRNPCFLRRGRILALGPARTHLPSITGVILRDLYSCSINIVQLSMSGGGGQHPTNDLNLPFNPNPEPLNLKPLADCCVNVLTLTVRIIILFYYKFFW